MDPDDEAQRDYLGDGVYVMLVNGMIKLYTLEGQVMFLEPSVFRKLVDYEQRIRLAKRLVISSSSQPVSSMEQGGISDRLGNFDDWGERIRDPD